MLCECSNCLKKVNEILNNKEEIMHESLKKRPIRYLTEAERSRLEEFIENIHYSTRYSDDTYEYRHVILPKSMLKVIPKDYFNQETGTLKILHEEEWRGLGITQSLGWQHYEIHVPEPHILLFKRECDHQAKSAQQVTQKQLMKLIQTIIVEIPAYALGFLSETQVVVSGGGGSSSSGNKRIYSLTKGIFELEMAYTLQLGDVPMSFTIDPSNKIIVAGINELNKLLNGKNRHLHVFQYNEEKKTMTILKSVSIFPQLSNHNWDSYQRITRLNHSRSLLAIASANGYFTILKYPSLKSIIAVTSVEPMVIDLDFSPNDTKLVYISPSKLYTFTLSAKRYTSNQLLKEGTFRTVRWINENSLITAIHMQGKTPFIQLWKANFVTENGIYTEKKIWTQVRSRSLHKTALAVTCMEIMRTNCSAVIACADLSIVIIDIYTLKILQKKSRIHGLPITALAINPKETLVLTASADSRLQVIDIRKKKIPLVTIFLLFFTMIVAILAIFGNTCYVNSILQILYYSKPFRYGIVRYPEPISLFPIPLSSKTSKYSGACSEKYFASLNLPSITSTRFSLTSFGTPFYKNNGSSIDETSSSNNVETYKKRLLAEKFNVNVDSSYCSRYGMKESLFTCVRDIFSSIIQSHVKDGICSPTRFIEVLRRENEHFRSNLHQDAHEFFNYLLNAILESVEEYDKSNVCIDNNISFNNKNTQCLSSKWVHSIFEGLLTTEIQCLTCGNITSRDESFLDLSININKNTSVTSCLNSFFAPEMLCEKNKFHCDFCGDLQEAKKCMKIKRLPEILTLHLKRFKCTEENGDYKFFKLFHTVVYPYHLRLPNTANDLSDSDCLYELYAVVVHLGSGPCHGHYVSVIKTESGWTLFDDERVEPVNDSFVRRFFGDFPGEATAYVLFYQTVDMGPQGRFTSSNSKTLSEALKRQHIAEIALSFPNFHEQTFRSSITNPILPDKVSTGLTSLFSKSKIQVPLQLLQPLEPVLCTEQSLNLNKRSFLRNIDDPFYQPLFPDTSMCLENNDRGLVQRKKCNKRNIRHCLDTGKDVYETPDLMEESLTQSYSLSIEEETVNEDISSDKLNLGMAKNRFLKEQVNAEEVDFSERIGQKNARSYVTKNFHDYGVIEETVVEKLARLKRELEEVRDELNFKKLQNGSTNDSSLNKSFADLNELDLQASELQNKTNRSAIAVLSKRLEEFNFLEPLNNEEKNNAMKVDDSLANQSLKYTFNYNPISKGKHKEFDISDLENRLTLLEKSLGINNMHSYILKAPILPTLSHLSKKITLLTSNQSYIDSITKKVKDLVTEMEVLSEKKSKMDPEVNESISVFQEQKIDALYSSLETIESISPILPNLLDRLKALRTIHADAATVTTGLKDCTERQHIIQEELVELKETLERVEFVIKESKNTIQSNMKEIENMVKGLEQKIEYS
ncbi:hypothetical protein PMAC_002477 [Pneumocystis sp. 'macacae']|nr:hypothetical protein PMAC_002477 [Pneumocystis sp. 'macacae']